MPRCRRRSGSIRCNGGSTSRASPSTGRWPFSAAAGPRWTIRYLQRINGSQEGTIDFWVRGGLETRIADGVSFEVSLNHFCRHLTSVQNPYVLNLNELTGPGLGAPGGRRAGSGLRALHRRQPRFPRRHDPGLQSAPLPSSRSFRWRRNGSGPISEKIYYDAALSIGLTRGTDLFVRATHHYAYPATAYIGLRFRSAGRHRADHGQVRPGIRRLSLLQRPQAAHPRRLPPGISPGARAAVFRRRRFPHAHPQRQRLPGAVLAGPHALRFDGAV